MPAQPSLVSFPKFTFLMDPTPETVRRDILLLERKIKDYSKPLQYSKQIIIGDIRVAFLTETDPVTGAKWDRLSDRAEREAHLGVLRRTRTNAKMYRAVTNRFNYGVTRQGVYLNQSRVPFYANYHQQDDAGVGSMRISNEEIIAERKRLFTAGAFRTERNAAARIALIKKQATENVRSMKQDEMRDKGQGRIPQRRFIGPSQAAQEKLFGVFDEWAQDAITIYKRGNILVRRRLVQ